MKAPSRFNFKQAVQLFAIDPDGLVTLVLVALNDRLFPDLTPPEPVVVGEYGLKGSPLFFHTWNLELEGSGLVLPALMMLQSFV